MDFHWSNTSKPKESKNYDFHNFSRNTQLNKDLKLNTEALINESIKLSSDENHNDALNLINLALKYESNNEGYLNIKAIVLERLKEYEKSEKCYDKALRINPNSEIIRENKAEMLYDFAKELSYTAKKQYALDTITKAIESLPKHVNAEKYYELKSRLLLQLNNEIESAIYRYKAEKQYDKLNKLNHKLNLFEKHENDTLITITGTYMYHNFKPFKKGTNLTLTKEEDNEYDEDAIVVTCNDYGTVGYVANSSHTVAENTKSSSEIKNIIDNPQNAEVLFILLEKFVIAKLIDNNEVKLIDELKAHDKKVKEHLSEMDNLIDDIQKY